MSVAIHLSFMEAVGHLQTTERRQVEGTIRRLSETGPTPGMRPHRLSGRRSDILSLSVNMDLRILALTQGGNYVLVHVGHHDDAYEWAEKNSTGVACAAAFGVTHRVGHHASDTNDAEGAVLETFGLSIRKALEAVGCPAALVGLLAQASDEGELVERMELLAPEWQELVLDAVSGAKPQPPTGTPSNIWVVPSDDALKQAIGLPDASWRIFLHPSQREVVEAETDRDLVVVGGPGTGKNRRTGSPGMSPHRPTDRPWSGVRCTCRPFPDRRGVDDQHGSLSEGRSSELPPHHRYGGCRKKRQAKRNGHSQPRKG